MHEKQMQFICLDTELRSQLAQSKVLPGRVDSDALAILAGGRLGPGGRPSRRGGGGLGRGLLGGRGHHGRFVAGWALRGDAALDG